MKLNHLMILIGIFTLIACKKKETADPSLPKVQDPVSNDYYPMEVGNYWIYEFQTKDPNGNIVGNTSYDTVRVVSDTVISNETYFVLTTNKPFINSRKTLRDSSGYIIDQNGTIKLLPEANETIYNFHYGFVGNDTAYAYWEEFEDEISILSPTGNYECIARFAKHQAWPEFGGITAVDSNLYAEIGQIIRSYSYLSGSKMYGELIDYNLEE